VPVATMMNTALGSSGISRILPVGPARAPTGGREQACAPARRSPARPARGPAHAALPYPPRRARPRPRVPGVRPTPTQPAPGCAPDRACADTGLTQGCPGRAAARTPRPAALPLPQAWPRRNQQAFAWAAAGSALRRRCPAARAPRARRARTRHRDLVAGLGVAQEVGAQALLGRVVRLQLRVPVRGPAHAERGRQPIKVVAVPGGRDGVQPHAVRHLLALRVHLGALRARGRPLGPVWAAESLPSTWQDPARHAG